jgi:pSer/pThr/pTyr-binding forkhead associated (FHA) protein
MNTEMQFWLEHLNGSRVKLQESGLELGSGAASVFRVLDARISLRHARIEVRGSDAFLTPLGVSTCQLNGKQIDHPKSLQDGDWLALAPGQLFRFAVTRLEPSVWRIRLGAVEHTLLPNDQLRLPGARLNTTQGNTLELRVKEPARYLGKALRPSVLSWSLCQGATVHLVDGTVLTVLDGPVLPPRPRSWFSSGQLCYQPPDRCVSLSASGILHLGYDGRDLFADVSDMLLLVKALLLSAGDSVLLADYGDADMLLRLRETIIMAGGDGFALLPESMGRVRLLIGDGIQPTIDATLAVPERTERRWWWLCSADGSCWRLGQHGLLMGRHEDCDITFEAPYVHRYHAMLQLDENQPVLSALGRHATFLDGGALEEPTRLTSGAEIRIEPHRRMWLVAGQAPTREASPYRLSLPDGSSVAYHQERVELGSDPKSDRCLPDWPATLSLIRSPSTLYARLRSGDVRLDGEPMHPQKFYPLAPGARLSADERHLEVVSITNPVTIPRIEQIAVRPHVKGGRVWMRMSGGAVKAVNLNQDLLLLLQILLEAAVGSRLRGLIETRPSMADHGMSQSRPMGGMALHELRLELLSERRVSLTVLVGLIEQLRGRLLIGGIDGFELIQFRDRWVWLSLEPSCIVDLYQ